MAITVNGTTINSLNVGNTQVKKVLVRQNESSEYTVVYVDGYSNIPAYNVVQVSSTASQQFKLKSNGYYESQCKGINNGWSLCRVEFNKSGNYTVKCISNGENNWDFGILSNINNTLEASNKVDTSGVKKSFKGAASSSVKSVTYSGVKAGDYIYVKYRKDGSVNQNYDTFQFKIV